MRVCVLGQSFGYMLGGGLFWVYLNWALGLHRAGLEVIWLETVGEDFTPETFGRNRAILEKRIAGYQLPAELCFVRDNGAPLPEEFGAGKALDEIAGTCDLLVSLCYRLPESVTRQFRRSALIDIDPGLLQHWLSAGYFELAPYDVLFTISDAIGRPNHPIPTLGKRWIHLPQCVDTQSWPVTPSTPEDAFTTISHWEAHEYVVESPGHFYENTKKIAFEPFLTLPNLTTVALELALCIDPAHEEEWRRLRELGWRLRSSAEISSSPEAYQHYIQAARGEFSVCKPSYRKMQSGWISDRSLCFLASGKPVIVQDTGHLDYLPRGSGFLRFETLSEAASQLDQVNRDYTEHAQAARFLAESHFDARRLATRLVEIACG